MRGFQWIFVKSWTRYLFEIIFVLLFFLFNSSYPTNVSEMAIVPYDPSSIILSPFHAKERTFQFAGRTLTVFQNWNDVGVAAVIWDAAIVLGRYLEKIAVQLRDKKVIELGAGTGFAGIVASLLGGHVTITDRKMALNVTRMNVEGNLGERQNLVEIKELEWGQNISSFTPPFDYVLGADIVYIEDTFNDLLKTLRELCDENTVVLLACKIRYERDKRFFGLLSKYFVHESVLYDQEMGITLFEARKIS
ncbi:protein N-lysine methyltransferase METTL21A-like [Montipora foliosa]|uniref:protein N-lysine methyltransferase METTL21A-like n=1 Tax=Montipora foliosa TaxID=591990 RepID=UPI0035F1871B